jgi:hypothetical protein
MSQEVLDDGWEAHLPRAQRLIELDRRRQEWVDRRWQVSISERIEPGRQARLHELLAALPVDLVAPRQASSGKRLHLMGDDEQPSSDGVSVLCGQDSYRLVIRHGSWQQELAPVPVGERISPLATKARRQHNQERYHELNGAGDRPCAGTHMSLRGIDVDATIGLLRSRPDLFFVLFDHPERPDPQAGEMIRSACINCTYLGPHPFGMPYFGYAELTAVVCPPLLEGVQRPLLQSLQLALATGRWLYYPSTISLAETPPLAAPYTVGEQLPDLSRLPHPAAPDQVLDHWLDWGSDRACLERVLRLANTACQQLDLGRADAGMTVNAVESPQPWTGDR